MKEMDVLEVLQNDNVANVCAPMVRYSKLEFRSLVRKYGCDLCFTPMIMADSFVQSLKARHNEFTTSEGDHPLIVQFASKNVDDFVKAAELVSPYCNGVDLNCGCPQRWALNAGYGAHLLTKPQLVKDLVRQVRNTLTDSKFTVSVKMRLVNDLKESVELCRGLESAGVSFLTVHGRTVKDRCEPVDCQAIKDIVHSVHVPVIANGDVKTLTDCTLMKEATQCAGVMSARGILQNPALFSGCEVTPIDCVQEWINLCSSSDVGFQCFHHHLVFMLEKVLPKIHRLEFNNLQSFDKVCSFLEEHLPVEIPPISMSKRKNLEYKDVNDGSYFKSKVCEPKEDSEEYLDASCIYGE